MIKKIKNLKFYKYIKMKIEYENQKRYFYIFFFKNRIKKLIKIVKLNIDCEI